MSFDTRVYTRYRVRWPEPRPDRDVEDPVAGADLLWVAHKRAQYASPAMPFPWTRALAYRACDLVLGERVLPWPQWRERTSAGARRPLPALSELLQLSEADLPGLVGRLRAQLMWLDMRRRRMYERPLPVHAFDSMFGRWLRTLPESTVVDLAQRFLHDWNLDTAVGLARARLAYLRPMPLALLWPFHVFRCAHTDALEGCESIEDMHLEYVTLFAAVHACRALADYQRTHASLTRFGPWRWSPDYWSGESEESYVRRMLDEVDLQALPASVVDAFVRLRVGARQRSVEPGLRWRLVVGPACECCQEAARAEAPAQLAPQDVMKAPPFRAGCTCEVVFDPENDPSVEAPWEEDGARWARERRRDAEFPGMRVLLRAMELATSVTTALPKEDATSPT